MQKLSLALDWTPNTNHTGFYVARNQGFYQELGLDLEFISPDIDHYETTSIDRVLSGNADIGMGPSEYVIHSHQVKDKPKLIAIGTTLGKDASAFVTPRSSGIIRPKDLDGKTYLAYGNQYEEEILKQLIINDGGKGELVFLSLNRLEVWPLFLNGIGQATWIFLPWEKFEADERGVGLNVFPLEDYGIPYGYSPVLFVNEEKLERNRELFTKFLKASRKGFEFALEKPLVAASILFAEANHPALPNLMTITQSQEMINDYYLEEGHTWGWMTDEKWANFHRWLTDLGVLSDYGKGIPATKFYYNLLFCTIASRL